ncbi:Mitochondrial chaperone BCS1 [Colletotrichum higginsianum IMI 349063]|uniref:Mitochondrial chaperone BCS1 n=3 Tax=Colletotrichum higginsianum TaxID=80884 RepID=A0A1B7XT34_COLHI|nr:Mitochondrial chaperone BCS1 [Colletotrichum higginsianum IMI 349063]OBR02923.1 Mitochondrial chaperone BCS1 [Colletotrichum higginsianum IMI 349063]TID07688.1 putative mitochondrial chaperone BCS1-B [Colletotrichum higginsianum]GJD00886.1 mitochondrial chaperone BCS1 [Colletotrichum higginsianum]
MDTDTQSAFAEPINTSTSTPQPAPQLALLDFFFPGFSVFTTAFQRYLGIDLNVYIPLVILCGGATFAWRYFSDYIWEKVEKHLMSTVEVRTDDEIYNILMSWVAAQRFAKNSRRFVVNTNLSSRSWFLWRWDDEEEESDDTSPVDGSPSEFGPKKKPLAYTPSFGSHSFWYRGHLLLFKRSQNREQASYLVVSEREEISLSCFGRNPWILKELLQEARAEYQKKDSQKTMIYRGSTRAGSTEPTWQRCMARTSRPFSTVILNEKTKKELVDDVADYLSPATRKWYSNRGIPWRRGYLLTGPPGTGKSSLSLALAGFFKMRIYIVSLSSISANEENLATLFAELPRRCVVLLEDIDTAGLTHTREDNGTTDTTELKEGSGEMVPGQLTPGVPTNQPSGRLSLSGLLNILDGVASQEGRVLIMTTNHIEKLDKALIRPGRVDQIVKFTLADDEIIGAIFRAIYAPLEGDENDVPRQQPGMALALEAEKDLAGQVAKRTADIVANVEALSEVFVDKIPAHEFSPAEIQGYLMKHKRSAEAAVAEAEGWVAEMRKEKREKELKVAEEKRQAETKKKKEAEEKKRKEEAEEKKREERKNKRKGEKKSRSNKERSESSASSGSDSSTGPESVAPAKVTTTAAVSEVKADDDGANNTSRKRDSGYGTPVEV